jgi:hypothetical protein
VRKYTRDHHLIQAWAEERGGAPARVREAGLRKEAAVLRIAFGPIPPTWEAIDWPTFFAQFDAADLTFLYEESAGSRICKLVKGHTVGS